MIISFPFIFLTNPSLIFLWVILEIRSIIFICIALSEEETKKKESFLTYFLIQSFASAFLLVCLFSWISLNKTINLENPNNITIIIIFLIALKIAIGPIHFWLIKISKLISWFVIGTLLTWQKIIPLSFLSTFSINFLLGGICVISLLVGTLRQLKLTSLKILIVFSSIGHLGWIIFPMLKYSTITITYLLLYSLIVLPMIRLFFFSNYQHLFNQTNYKIVFCLSLLIFSLSGIPPLIGFLLKWISLNSIIPSILIIIAFSLIACLRFYIYIRIVYKRFLLRPFSIKQTLPILNINLIWVINFFLPILPIMW